MRKLVAACYVVALLSFAALWMARVHAQVQYKAAESYMPDVVTIGRTLPDRARICVEPAGGGLLVCKPALEVRRWFFNPDKK